jgi:hypothetical protein
MLAEQVDKLEEEVEYRIIERDVLAEQNEKMLAMLKKVREGGYVMHSITIPEEIKALIAEVEK